MPANSRSLSRVFVQDAKLYLSYLWEFTEILSEGGATREATSNAFRSAHSLKSEAAFLGHDELAGLAAGVESILGRVSSELPEVSLSSGKTLADALETLQRAFDSVASAPKQETFGRRAGDRPTAALELGSFERQLMREAHARGEVIYRLRCRIEEEEEMEQARRFLLISNLEQKTNLIDFSPALDKPARSDGVFEGIASSPGGRRPIEESTSIAGIRDVHIEELPLATLLEATPESDLVAQLATGQPALSVSIPSRRYEELLMFSSELTRLLKGAADGANIPLIRRVAGLIEEYLLQSSETPAKMLFDILRPRIRSFAEGLSRSVVLETRGDDTAVFVTTAYALLDSLIQLVHNAVLHGIEEPEERKRHGKHPQGRIQVSCRRLGERIVFDVEDDGRGMSPGHLESHYRQLFDRDAPESVLEIVAEPGFSTRKEQFSGDSAPTGLPRGTGGIGLDGIRYTVERLFGGELTLHSEPGKGSTFTISIPANRKLISVVIARSGETSFAVPAALVIDALPVQRRLISRDHRGHRYIRYDGQNVRLYRIEEGQSVEDAGIGRQFAVLVRLGRNRSAILVDELVSNELALLDESHRSHVFSQRAGEYVQFFVPLQLL
ncbi:MAG: ATP-binding protein [Spirochaetota bacterium]